MTYPYRLAPHLIHSYHLLLIISTNINYEHCHLLGSLIHDIVVLGQLQSFYWFVAMKCIIFAIDRINSYKLNLFMGMLFLYVF